MADMRGYERDGEFGELEFLECKIDTVGDIQLRIDESSIEVEEEAIFLWGGMVHNECRGVGGIIDRYRYFGGEGYFGQFFG